ncbi:aldose epimerase family protein [Acholeplasma granularum]|uniref:aldose epimerase family protein n=1 Tax=Acholeplasma granularum TaxID=264635 RepID=UPI00046E87B4|nr:aldose epimerase family protein [Acholeplasma granularum]
MEIIKLKNDFQELTILTTGATIHEWICFKEKINILISNEDLSNYQITGKGFLNQTIGRVANRIKDGKFTLNNKTYQLARNFDGGHHGHGGPTGFYLREFEIIEKTNHKVKLKYVSKHLEEGYPGTVTLFVTYEIKDIEMIITYDATTSLDTIMSITNHAHFNLSTEDTILNHEVLISSNKVLVIDQYLVPTGNYIHVENTSFDLRNFKKLKEVLSSKEVLNITNGLDHAYIFGKDKKVHLKYKNRNLIIKTTYPGVQVYSMNHNLSQKLLNNRIFKKHAGIAFEPQYEPNAINIPHFNQPILKSNEKYHHQIIYKVFED